MNRKMVVMRFISSHKAKQQFGDVLAWSKHQPVVIRKYKHRAAVVISPERYDEYERLRKSAAQTEAASLLDDLEHARGSRQTTLARSLFSVLRRAQ